MLLGQATGHGSFEHHSIADDGTAVPSNNHFDLLARDSRDFACDDVRENRLTHALEEFFLRNGPAALISEMVSITGHAPGPTDNGTHWYQLASPSARAQASTSWRS